MGIFVITLVGAVVVALLGLWSVRIASAESEAKTRRTAHVQAFEKRDRDTDDKNRGNPAAMAMSGPTGSNVAK